MFICVSKLTEQEIFKNREKMNDLLCTITCVVRTALVNSFFIQSTTKAIEMNAEII